MRVKWNLLRLCFSVILLFDPQRNITFQQFSFHYIGLTDLTIFKNGLLGNISLKEEVFNTDLINNLTSFFFKTLRLIK